MYKVYVLQSEKDLKTYTGYSHDAQGRLLEHNAGKVTATKNRRPLKIIYTENCETESEAKMREKYWKSAAGRKNLKRIFSGFPPHFRNKK